MDLATPPCENVRARLLARFGEAAEIWWRMLPAVIDELAARWELVSLAPVGRDNTSLVVRCLRGDGSVAILKLSPDPQLAGAENAALSAWAGLPQVPAVWSFDQSLGALLLEGIRDETPLSESSAPRSVDEITQLIGTLHRVVAPLGMPGISLLPDRVEWVFNHWSGRYRETRVVDVVPLALLDRGRVLARSLAGEGQRAVLLHGDLHPGNVLNGGSRGLVAIDPRPCIGDGAYDLVDWVYWNTDPDHWHTRSHDLASRLELDPERVWSWCSAFAALIAATKVAHGAERSDVEHFLAIAA